MGRQGRVGGPPPQGPVPVLAGLMDGNGCSVGTHILSYKPGFLLPASDAGLLLVMPVPRSSSRLPDDCAAAGTRPVSIERKRGMMAQHKSVDFDVSEEALGKLPKATNAATSLGDALRKINVAGFFKGALEGSEQLIQRAGEYRAAMDALAAAAQRNGASAGAFSAAPG